jgi:putative membrane protein
MAEVEFGKLATEKAASPQVKQFGQRMIDDHCRANDELKGIASSQGIQVPDKLSAKDEMTKERLSKTQRRAIQQGLHVGHGGESHQRRC